VALCQFSASAFLSTLGPSLPCKETNEWSHPMTELHLREFLVSFIYTPSLSQSSTEQFNCNVAFTRHSSSYSLLSRNFALEDRDIRPSLKNTTTATALCDSLGYKNYKFTYLLYYTELWVFETDTCLLVQNKQGRYMTYRNVSKYCARTPLATPHGKWKAIRQDLIQQPTDAPGISQNLHRCKYVTNS